MDAFQLLEEAGKVSPAQNAAVDAAVDLVLTAASQEGSGSAPAPSLGLRRAWRHRRIAFGAVASTVAVALAAAALLAVTASAPTGSSRLPVTTAGLSAVQGCPGEYATAGTLKQVSGTRLTIQQANDTGNVTVATDASTVITMPATGTVSDITNGLQVMVQGTWSGRSLAATQVTVGVGQLGPPAAAAPPRLPRHRGHHPSLNPPNGTPRLVSGTAEDVHDGSFTLILRGPAPGAGRIDVVTSNSTTVKTDAKVSLSQLTLGADVVAAGPEHNGVITAGSVTEPPGGHLVLPPGPIKIRPHGCSASAITTAAILAGS
jgi:hypothetical protein